ncbi:histidine kinase [Bacilliculturomica massiliensis]|uniref:histidine kinase n=1 Tax=Bacilliculturomica massiliensis TaxID=1917867 RepID=UPI001030B220|nr:histidine kinase [Bacilliculturomica massiliensis]
MIQKTKWGYIDWWYLPENEEGKRSMNVGVTYIMPGLSQSPHIHYGHEQLLYVLEGEGLYNIDGEEVPFRPGMHFYMEADTLHDTINTGKGVVRELLISNPVPYRPSLSARHSSGDVEPEGAVRPNLYAAVESIRAQLLEAVRFPFTIFDADWEIVMQNQFFSKFCLKQCRPDKNPEMCTCMRKRIFDMSRTSSCIEFTCPYGMTIYHQDIIFKGEIIGIVRGGHFFSSDAGSEFRGELYDTPRSTGIGIQRLIQQMADSVLSYCEFYVSREMLQEKEQILKNTEQRRIRLEQDLTVVKETVTNLKINHHFLFNTLNSMAEMALSGERDTLYDAIIDMAKMFRYTMATDLRFVELRSELEYLNTYLNLQKLRYGNALQINFEVPGECQNIPVPFNFLQPIVENAFTHGFQSSGKKRIWIEVKRDGDYAVICSCNNGTVPDEVTLNRVQRSLDSNSGHGLSLIYAKLKSAYGGDFRMKIAADSDRGTCVTVYIPIYEPEDGESKEGTL